MLGSEHRADSFIGDANWSVARRPDEMAADQSPAIELLGLSKRYGGLRAVDRLDLSIRPGEFFTLLGPSGCGKSTTLRMVAGLEAPTAGRVYLEGRNVTTAAPDRRSTSTVFQDYALFPHLTVLGNVLFPLRMKRLPKSERLDKARKILQLVGLTGYEDRKPEQLSGGQRQRVALARSLVWQPRALLLDEPLAALDFQLRQEMQNMLKELQSKVGITFMFVTHDQTEAFSLSDRIGVMNQGRLEQVGTPRELYNRPQTLFVATFLGNINLIRGEVERIEKDRLVVRCGTVRVVGLSVSESLPPGAKVIVGIRPESIRQTAARNAAVNTANCRVLSTTFQGSQEEILLEIGQGTTWRCYGNRDTTAPDLHDGQSVNTTWDVEDVLIFADSNEADKPPNVPPPGGQRCLEKETET